MSEGKVERNRKFVEEHKEQLLKQHRNKYLLVCHGEVVSSYDTYEAAAEAGVEQFGLDQGFLVYHLVDEDPVNFVIGAIL